MTTPVYDVDFCSDDCAQYWHGCWHGSCWSCFDLSPAYIKARRDTSYCLCCQKPSRKAKP